MLTLLSRLPHGHKLAAPTPGDAALSTNALLEKLGLVHRVASGLYMASPILQRVQHRIEQIATREAYRRDMEPISLPFLVPAQWLARSGKTATFSREFYSTAFGNKRYLLSPSTEEAVIQYLASAGTMSYRQMPLRLVHPHHVFRHIHHPEGFFKSRDFRAFLVSTFDPDRAAFLKSASLFRELCEDVFGAIEVPVFPLTGDEGAIIEYFFECDVGDRTVDQGVVAKRVKEGSVSAAHIPAGSELANIAMGYSFDRVSAFGLRFRDRDNALRTPIMGTFGIGLQRCVYAVFQRARAGAAHGFNEATRPFDATLMPMVGDGRSIPQALLPSCRRLVDRGLDILVDDRRMPLSNKLALADFFSIPVRIPYGRREMDGQRQEVRLIGEPRPVSIARHELETFVVQACRSAD